MGLRGHARRAQPRRPPPRESTEDETAHAPVGARHRHVETPQRNPVSDWAQGRDRPRSAVRLHRTQSASQKFLHPQSDRLGASPVRLDGSEGSPALRRSEQGSVESVERTRGVEERARSS